MLPDLTTPRLRMTPVSDEDLELMRALNAEEAVMRNLTGRPSTAEETDAEWSRRLDERSDHEKGLGYWAGWCEDAFVGWWGLGSCSWDTTTANLGYRLLPASWGKGLATEGSATLLRHAFGAAGMASVWASTTQQNVASQRVLTKLSMRYLGIQYEQCQYRITSDEWAASVQGRTRGEQSSGTVRG
ncbi:MAG: GNAT family N-acetyltransferase [Nocardioidaceae bacterium]